MAFPLLELQPEYYQTKRTFESRFYVLIYKHPTGVEKHRGVCLDLTCLPANHTRTFKRSVMNDSAQLPIVGQALSRRQSGMNNVARRAEVSKRLERVVTCRSCSQYPSRMSD